MQKPKHIKIKDADILNIRNAFKMHSFGAKYGNLVYTVYRDSKNRYHIGTRFADAFYLFTDRVKNKADGSFKFELDHGVVVEARDYEVVE